MKKYERPVVMVNEELAEGVYAASGTGSASCYTVRCNIVQKPETGRETYKIQFNADHNATDHHSTGQVMTINFNVPVEFVSMRSGGEGTATYKSGSGTTTLVIDTTYHNNNPEYGIGLGELEVKTNGAELTTVTASLSCNYTCGKHDSLGNY